MMSRLLRSLILRWLLDDRAIALRRFVREIPHRLYLKKREVVVFLQLDDPYSYLLSHYLAHLAPRYAHKLRFRYILGQALGGDFAVEPALQARYAVEDCRRLAAALDVPFIAADATPSVEMRRSLLDFLATEHDEPEFADTLTKALAAYWTGDSAAIERLIGHARGDPTETGVRIGRNQLLLRKMGHYQCATMYYGGEWYWGIDRLPLLVERLEGLRLSRYREPTPALETLERSMRVKLPASVPPGADKLPKLELFHSFRSPYAYLALQSAFDIADAWGLELDIRPVLPLVQRGARLPRTKLLYIVTDAARVAARKEIPFGKIADSLGKGTENCLAAFAFARTEGRERQFVAAAGEAIFAEGIDVAGEDGMRQVAEQAGLDPDAVADALDDADWQTAAEENRAALTAAGLWGVPGFRLGDRAWWGQDRDWLIARELAALHKSTQGGDSP